MEIIIKITLLFTSIIPVVCWIQLFEMGDWLSRIAPASCFVTILSLQTHSFLQTLLLHLSLVKVIHISNKSFLSFFVNSAEISAVSDRCSELQLVLTADWSIPWKWFHWIMIASLCGNSTVSSMILEHRQQNVVQVRWAIASTLIEVLENVGAISDYFFQCEARKHPLL